MGSMTGSRERKGSWFLRAAATFRWKSLASTNWKKPYKVWYVPRPKQLPTLVDIRAVLHVCRRYDLFGIFKNQ